MRQRSERVAVLCEAGGGGNADEPYDRGAATAL